MNFVLEPLPYADSALEPYIGRATMVLHHQKHHGGYLEKLEELIGGKPEAEQSLEEIILGSEGPVFDNAAQVWNHSFYWRSMKPDGGGEPNGRFGDALLADFGSFRAFRSTFIDAGTAHFGSGWLWLVVYGGRLRVLTTPDADLPLVYRATALLCADLWEHAYYLDYHNERGKYLEAFFDHLADWDFAAANWGAAEESRVRNKSRSAADFAQRAKSSTA